MGAALGTMLGLVWGCSAPPAQQLNLYGTSWNVMSVGDVAVPSGEMTIVFSGGGDPDQQATVRTGCRTLVVGVAWDDSGSAISFEAPAALSSGCAADLAARDKALADAIEGTIDWSIDSSQEISLHGSADIRLRRV